MRLFTTSIFSLLILCTLSAQEKSQPDPMIGVHFAYGFQLPGGDLKTDFGWANIASITVEYFTPNNLIFGVEGGVFFGNRIATDVIASLRGPDSLLIGSNRSVANIRLKERGIQIGVHVGKLFAFKKAKSRSGIRATIGLGLLQHKIRIQEDFQVPTPQIFGEYAKGYDQLTNGIALNEFIGYQHFSKNGLINFRVGVEFTQGFTQNRRSWDFVENRKKDEKRLDLAQTFKLAWILPFYLVKSPEEIFY